MLSAPGVAKIVAAKNKEGLTALEQALNSEWYQAAGMLLEYPEVTSSDVYAYLRWDIPGSLSKMLQFSYRPKNLNKPNERDGMTLFMRGCYLCDGTADNLVLFLQTFSDIKVDLRNPKNNSSGVHYACKAGLFEVLEYLLTNKYELPSLNLVDDKGYSPFIAAISSGNPKLVGLLLRHPHIRHRLDRNISSPLGTALTFAIDAVRLNNDSPRGHSDRVSIVQDLLVDKFVDLNLTHANHSPLMKLATLGDDFDPVVDIVRMHVDNGGIDPFYANPEDGNTALHIAAKFSTRGLLLLLLAQKDIDIDCTNKQLKTPLHIATEECKVEVVRLLCKYGYHGMCSLFPIMLDCMTLLVFVVASRANRAHKNAKGDTALDIAKEHSFTEIITLLSPTKLKRQLSKYV